MANYYMQIQPYLYNFYELWLNLHTILSHIYQFSVSFG